MTEAIIVALITGGISLIGTLATTRSSAKSTQALVDYKLKELKESVDKHNSIIERTYMREGRMENCEHDIRDIKQRIKGNSVVQDGVATIPIAGYNRLGVVRLDPAGFAGASVDGILALVPPTNAQISTHTHTQRPITTSCMDYAVKAAMCDGKGAAWTDAERLAALARMGCTVGDDGTVKWSAV